MRIDSYLMILLFIGTMEMTKKYLEKGMEVEKTSMTVQAMMEAQSI